MLTSDLTTAAPIRSGRRKSPDRYSKYMTGGDVVYSAENIDPLQDVDKFWNGTFKNKSVDDRVYVYVINVLFQDGFFETLAGDVTVIHN